MTPQNNDDSPKVDTEIENEPYIDDNEDILKPSANPYLWLGLLLLPVVLLLFASIRGDKKVEEQEVIPQSIQEIKPSHHMDPLPSHLEKFKRRREENNSGR